MDIAQRVSCRVQRINLWIKQQRPATVLAKSSSSDSRGDEMRADYLKFVEWSERDRLFIGYCPDLFIGGVCHGRDEQKVYRDLSRLVAAEIVDRKRAKRALAAKRALVAVPIA